MARCEKCNVAVRGDQVACPLCQNRLSGEADEPIFPEIKTVYNQYRSMFRYVYLSVIIAAAVSVAVNFMFPTGSAWSMYVVMGLICFSLFVYNGIKRFQNIPRFITNQTVMVAVLGILWDLVAGWRGWSLDYVVPCACIIAMATMGVIAHVRRMPASDYAVCLAVDAVFGIVPVIFLVLDMLTVTIPSVICILASIISLSTLIIFEGRNIRQEIIKRFHM